MVSPRDALPAGGDCRRDTTAGAGEATGRPGGLGPRAGEAVRRGPGAEGWARASGATPGAPASPANPAAGDGEGATGATVATDEAARMRGKGSGAESDPVATSGLSKYSRRAGGARGGAGTTRRDGPSSPSAESIDVADAPSQSPGSVSEDDSPTGWASTTGGRGGDAALAGGKLGEVRGENRGALGGGEAAAAAARLFHAGPPAMAGKNGGNQGVRGSRREAEITGLGERGNNGHKVKF